MKITQEVRDYAKDLESRGIDPNNLGEEISIRMVDVESQMQAKSEEFKASGSELYHKVY